MSVNFINQFSSSTEHPDTQEHVHSYGAASHSHGDRGHTHEHLDNPGMTNWVTISQVVWEFDKRPQGSIPREICQITHRGILENVGLPSALGGTIG